MDPKSEIKELLESGDTLQARRLIEKYEPFMLADSEFYSIKSVLAVIEQDFEEAYRILEKGLKVNSEDPDLLYNFAFVLRERGSYEESLNYYEKALIHSKTEDLREVIHNDILLMHDYLVSGKNNMTENPLVSIVVLAYNKLEYTKLCIDSIYRFTANIDYELIVVNNGSTDETQEFFESLPKARIVHLEDNVGPVNGFNEGIKVAKGRYTACISNDFILTPRWLDNLLICIDSDPSIGFVSPGASNVSNFQGIKGDYNTIQEMLEFAERYNQSEPKKWEERVRLLPCVLMARTALLQEIGGFDPRFYFGEFADDDISFRIRRKGYKLIYCKDTFTYHFGSITTLDAQINNKSLEISREIFREKYGLDAWLDATFNPIFVKALCSDHKGNSGKILGVNANCGSNPLQLKNYLQEIDVPNLMITNFCIDEKYKEDLETVSDHVIFGELSNIPNYFSEDVFDYIIYEHEGNYFQTNPRILEELKCLLEQNGRLGLRLRVSEIDERRREFFKDYLKAHNFTILFDQFNSIVEETHLVIVARKDV
ncbi:glycosyltransferase [Mesobacillus subterraneus]|uniref:glycosyltransferase n=1 Tax=Mesobacillus subterraneus TaxID=285983 RepID=UPI001CFCC3EC|nr:glycosyltransferase [Mesobacillus subterraneus]